MVVVHGAPEDAQAQDVAACRVLLVDRQPLFLAALSGLLAGAPLHARIDTRTRSDLDLTTAHFDLVICEVRAEPISGRDLLRAVANLHPPTRMILLGDIEDGPALLSAMGADAAGAFTKDTAPNEFIDGVRTVLSGRRALGSTLTGHLALGPNGPDPWARMREQNGLSQTELQVLTMLGGGLSAKQIALARSISPKTVRNHLSSIYRKLGLRSRTEAMLVAARLERAAR